MAAPKGNRNAVGNKGGGRPSAHDEIAHALDAHSMFFDEQDQSVLEAKIASGKFSIKDRFVLTAMEGDSSVINKAYHKAVPDNVDITSKGEKLTTSLDQMTNEELEAALKGRSTS